MESVFPFKEKKPIFTHWEQSHQTQPHDSSSRALDVDSVDLSSDDDEVENLLKKTLQDVQTKSVPSFNPLSSSPVRGSSGPRLAFHLLVMGGQMRKLRKIQGTWVQLMTLMILSQGGRSARPKSWQVNGKNPLTNTGVGSSIRL